MSVNPIRFTLCFCLPLLLLFPIASGTLRLGGRVVQPLLVCGYDVIIESLIKLRDDVTPGARE